MRDGAETECTGTTPWARACRFPAHCLRATLQQGARERILADTGPLEQGPGGWRPSSTSVPLGKDASAWPPAPARPFSKAHGKPCS